MTHQSIKNQPARLFILATTVDKTGVQDPLTKLEIYSLGAEKLTLGLPALSGNKVYMVPFAFGNGVGEVKKTKRSGVDLRTGDTLLFVDWDVQFL